MSCFVRDSSDMNRISHPFGNPWSRKVTLLPLYDSLVHHVFLLDCQRVPLNSQNTFVEKILTRQHRSSRQHFVMDHELLQTGPLSRGAKHRSLPGGQRCFSKWCRGPARPQLPPIAIHQSNLRILPRSAGVLLRQGPLEPSFARAGGASSSPDAALPAQRATRAPA